MATYYSIIQCVPDTFAGERLNIGVVVWGDGQIRCRFVEDWHRLRRFGLPDTTLVRDFAHRLQAASSGIVPLSTDFGLGTFDEKALEDAIRTWSGVIQFSQPRTSLLEPEIVLEDVARRALKSTRASARKRRGRVSVASMVQREVQRVVEERVGERGRELLHRSARIGGKSDDHNIDVVVSNGRPYLAGHGLSFEILDASEIRHHYNDLAWTIADVKRREPDLPFGVAVYPPHPDAPRTTRELFSRAERVFTNEGAIVLLETDVDDWAESVLGDVPAEVLNALR